MSLKLFIQAVTVKQRTNMSASMDENIINAEILACMDLYIHPLLGTALYNRLRTAIGDNTRTANEIALLDDYIANALVHFVMSELALSTNIKFFNQGAVRRTNQNAEQPSMSDLVDVSMFYKKRAEMYGERLVKYLEATASTTVFPEYLSPGTDIDDISPDDSAFKTSIYLGDVDDNENCKGYYA